MKRFAWLLWAVAVSMVSNWAVATDWPTYRGDAQRSARTEESLPDDLAVVWRHAARHAPQPAWSDRDTRMPFDRAMHPVIAGGRVFFGSSVDCKVYALDAASGRPLWTFFSGGPIRFAPAVDEDRLLVASDDGCLYCLAAADGRLLWKLPGGPTSSRVLGNGRLISRWPARGGPVVADGVVYFAAGIWPSEGIFIYAVETKTGKVLWCNDQTGSLWMAQPHPTANAASGVSAQGYLALAGDKLLVPTGRAVPAVFDRKTGQLLYFHLQKNGHEGGADIVAADGWFLNGASAFDLAGGDRLASAPKLQARLAAAWARQAIQWDSGEIRALQWTEKSGTDRKGATQAETTLASTKIADCPWGGTSLVVAGGKVVAAGGHAPAAEGSSAPASGKAVSQQDADDGGYGVVVCDIQTGDGGLVLSPAAEPLGLAVADGRLYVATAAGELVCLASRAGPPAEAAAAPQPPAATFDQLQLYEKAAEEIVRQTGVTDGYAIDLDCGDGALASALARQTNLQIYALQSDPDLAARARQNLDAAGLYGARVTVLAGSEAAQSLPDYLAYVVVSARWFLDGPAADAQAVVDRILRPFGGKSCTGRPAAMQVAARGPLEGAGQWTHQYCDPTNDNCSDDTILRGPLGVLWFADHNFAVPSRHGRGRAPLFLDGRLFVEGLDGILCVDAYNGRALWQHPLPGIQQVYDGEHLMGTSGTGSNWCLGAQGLYVHTGAECLRIDPATGRKLASFPAPPMADGSPGTWGVVALVDHTLFGTLADTRHLVTYRFREGDMNRQYTESVALFAIDAATGQLLWRYDAHDTLRHTAIAIGNGRVHLIDRPEAIGDRQREKRVGTPNPEDKQRPGKLLTLDAADGRVIWQSTDDIYGTMLVLSAPHNVLLMGYQDWRFKLASEVGGRMSAFDAAKGKRLWDVEASDKSRPVVQDRTIYLQPQAWDLLTGKPTGFKFDRSYGCGIPAGCTNMLVYRSATVGYLDLAHDYGTENYGGIRPGCWINAIPAGGLVLMPDATDRCRCSYLNKASIALAPYGLRPPTIDPPGGTRGRPLEVRLTSDAPHAQIRYTLDGSSPTSQSSLYTGPLQVESALSLRARAFAPDMPPSSVASAEFRVEPGLIPLDDPGWAVLDSPGGSPPASRWQLSGDFVTEESNHFLGTAGNLDPETDRPGTYRVFTPGKDWADGELSLEIASSDDDGLGVAFRFGGLGDHYLWSMDRQRSFRVLAARTGGAYRVLARNAAGYEKDRWYAVRIVLEGPKITVYVDGQKDLEATDPSLAKGPAALYAWGCAGAKFRNIRWTAR
ncbi:MAG: outer membrane protein assembly factor BamB family protein [Thermoguttaceae bacterium]